MMNKFLAFFLLAALAVSGCNLQQNGSTAVRQPTGLASPTALPASSSTDLPALAVAPTPILVGSNAATAQPAKPQAATALPTSQTTQAGAYPPNPVDVVQAFVEAYPDQTAEMEHYLSAAVRRVLPKGGPGELLKVQGDVTGFSVLSGSSIPNPPQAVVVAAIEAGEARVERTFTLIQENGVWVINEIK